jgi:hypothetical protein
MKTAVVIAGQLRSTRGYKELREVLPEADYYLATWSDSYGYDKVLATFNPKRHRQIHPAHFEDAKQQFWNTYKHLQPDATIRDNRFALLNGHIRNAKYDVVRLDNTFRMFLLNSVAIRLVEDFYDRIIKVRPDLQITNFSDITVQPHTIYTPEAQYRDDAKGQFTSDQVFFGDQATMTKIMGFWNEMPQFAAEDMGEAWLNPEGSFKRYIELYCKFDIHPCTLCGNPLKELPEEHSLSVVYGWDAALGRITPIT